MMISPNDPSCKGFFDPANGFYVTAHSWMKRLKGLPLLDRVLFDEIVDDAWHAEETGGERPWTLTRLSEALTSQIGFRKVAPKPVTISAALARLEKLGAIVKRRTTRGLRIRVVDYEQSQEFNIYKKQGNSSKSTMKYTTNENQKCAKKSTKTGYKRASSVHEIVAEIDAEIDPIIEQKREHKETAVQPSPAASRPEPDSAAAAAAAFFFKQNRKSLPTGNDEAWLRLLEQIWSRERSRLTFTALIWVFIAEDKFWKVKFFDSGCGNGDPAWWLKPLRKDPRKTKIDCVAGQLEAYLKKDERSLKEFCFDHDIALPAPPARSEQSNPARPVAAAPPAATEPPVKSPAPVRRRRLFLPPTDPAPATPLQAPTWDESRMPVSPSRKPEPDEVEVARAQQALGEGIQEASLETAYNGSNGRTHAQSREGGRSSRRTRLNAD